MSTLNGTCTWCFGKVFNWPCWISQIKPHGSDGSSFFTATKNIRQTFSSQNPEVLFEEPNMRTRIVHNRIQIPSTCDNSAKGLFEEDDIFRKQKEWTAWSRTPIHSEGLERRSDGETRDGRKEKGERMAAVPKDTFTRSLGICGQPRPASSQLIIELS